MVYERRIVKDLEGSGHGPIKEAAWYFPRVTRENCVRPVMITCVADRIQTGHLMSTRFERYSYTYLLDLLFVRQFSAISHISL
jgi:hypothetical protein